MNSLIKNFENKISCKLNIPCLATLSSQDLISLALKLESNVELDLAYCSSCEIGKLKEEYILKVIDEANYFLGQLGVDFKIEGENLFLAKDTKKIESENRRGFLKRLGKLSLGLTFWSIAPSIPVNEEDNNVDKPIKDIVSEKVLPTKRKILLETLRAKELDLKDKSVEVDKISFSSDKWIDFYKCTNCSICYNVCPTGALKGIDNKTKIQFEPSLCVKCKVCHEVCPEDCLHLEKELNLDYFVNGKKILAEHVIIQCSECLVPFSYKGDTTICPRCRQLEDEIKDMLEI
jgi:NAD-dependent dihydropyrimidine dehydrogenase PreA subunit